MSKFEKSFYQVFECSDPNDYWSYDETKILFESNDMGKVHGYAYNKHKESNERKLFVIIQPYDGSCRGGYGFTVEDNKVESKYFIFKLEWSQTDEDMVIVKAESREKAEAFLKRNKDLGPRYVTYYGEQVGIIEVK
jgi:hypothetical protein